MFHRKTKGKGGKPYRWFRAIPLIVAAVLFGLTCTSCFATQGDLDAMTASLSKVEATVAHVETATASLASTYEDVDATLEDQRLAEAQLLAQIGQLATDVDEAVQTAETAAENAGGRGEALIGGLASLPLEGQLGLAAGLAAMATNFWRDRKRRARGEPVATKKA
jgi:hypothetical protein